MPHPTSKGHIKMEYPTAEPFFLCQKYHLKSRPSTLKQPGHDKNNNNPLEFFLQCQILEQRLMRNLIRSNQDMTRIKIQNLKFPRDNLSFWTLYYYRQKVMRKPQK